jgi:hypothetical protein
VRQVALAMTRERHGPKVAQRILEQVMKSCDVL